ncbi:hypothetical protein [Rhodothalassium salexigens]|uniref:hypothetical protein n=1 Tax=Rhodothalassium salexigens TaxID=1086 RepID=UPI001912D868|nr:hypothetical protein [Rhodothalassium salexigens]
MTPDQEKSLRERVADVPLEWRMAEIGPLDQADRAAFVQMVTAAHVAADEARRSVGRWVDAARRAEATWDDIGRAVGISRQAAQQRFGGWGDTGETPGAAPGAVYRRRGLTAFNEVRVLTEEGAKGGEAVACGPGWFAFCTTDRQWTYHRAVALRPSRTIEAMTAEGWTLATEWYPFLYFKKAGPSLAA